MPDEFEELNESSHYDIAQVCINGHTVNSRVVAFPTYKNFCDQCGEVTFKTCEHCAFPIQGSPKNAFGFVYIPPRYCPVCGKIYPWTKTRLDAARELADDLTMLDDKEKEVLKKSITDIVQNTPQAEVASIKFKRLAAKAGLGTLDMFKSILVDVVSEAIKKTLFP